MGGLSDKPDGSTGASLDMPADSDRTRDHVTVLLVFVGAVLATAVLTQAGSGVYRFLFGDLNPLAVTTAVLFIGALSLRHVVGQGWFSLSGGTTRDLVVVIGLGAALAVPAIVIDLLGAFPRNLNVAFPAALLFYPSIALVAEVAFHLVPLAILASLWRITHLRPTQALLVSLGIAALTEPVFQVVMGAGHSPAWANAYVGFHLLIFSIVALAVFRRFGFLALYLFRVGYYLVWHVAWGHLRIPLLFD